jgi:hypothetical protein
MSNPAVKTQFGFADPNASPITINDLIALLNTLISSSIEPEYPNDEHPTFRLFYIIGPDEPSPEDHDKLWIQTDSTSRPIAAKLFTNGAWRRIYNGMLGEIRGFTGEPGYGPAYPPHFFNESGRGNIGGPYDGWAICNGQNGTPDLSDQFLIGAHLNKHDSHPAYKDGHWVTFIPGEGTEAGQELPTGGAFSEMIMPINLPPLDNSLPDPITNVLPEVGLYITGREYKIDATHTDVLPLIDDNYAGGDPPTGPGSHTQLLVKYGADPRANPPRPQRKLPVTPPFYALAWITFIGYGI